MAVDGVNALNEAGWYLFTFLHLELALIGLGALRVAFMVAVPLRRPPELVSIIEARHGVDYSNLPSTELFQTRDGTWLGDRHYAPAEARRPGRSAIAIHGSSGSKGTAIHSRSGALSTRAVNNVASVAGWILDKCGVAAL